MDELIQSFSLERISKSGGIFDVDKLNFINSHYMKTADIDMLTDLAIPYLAAAGYISGSDMADPAKRGWVKGRCDAAQGQDQPYG